MVNSRQAAPMVRLQAEAQCEILEQCARSPDKETGGFLVGCLRHDGGGGAAYEVRAATGPGLLAQHGVAHFRPDVDFANAELARLCRRDPRVRYLGTWHKHPDGAPLPSAGDLIQTRKIVDDPGYDLDTFLVIIAEGRAARLRSFIIGKSETAFREADMEIFNGPEPANHADDVNAVIARLESAGRLVARRRTPDDRTVLEVRRPREDVAVSFLLGKDDSDSRPEILVRRKLAWPREAADIPAAADRILGEEALAHGARISGVVDALRRQRLTADAVWGVGDELVLALHGPRNRLAGFLLVGERSGAPAVFGPELQPCIVETSEGIDAWARQVSKVLGAARSRARTLILIAVLAVAASACALVGNDCWAQAGGTLQVRLEQLGSWIWTVVSTR